MDIEGRSVIVLGLGREGASLARYLARRGAAVTVTDSAPPERLRERVLSLQAEGIRFALDGDHPEIVSRADQLFVSPGVPESSPVYVAARAAGLPIRSMTTLFFELFPGPIVGITGSSGKTTTTGLISHVLAAAGRDAVVGGNIGEPMLDLIPRIGPDTLVVLELSSFQLSILDRSPHVAVVTNVSPNHLDRHGTMAAYVAAKQNIVRHQTGCDVAVLNAADPAVRAFASLTPAETRWFGGPDVHQGATVVGSRLGLVRRGDFLPVMPVSALPLMGSHNVDNALAALAALDALDVPPEAMAAALPAYRPAPHRLQTVAELEGVRYVDDSIATSPSRAAVALRAIDSPVLLIAGGRDKHLPWDEFARLAARQARALFLLGEAAPLIESAVRKHLAGGRLASHCICRCSSLQEAVVRARRVAAPGDVVLLAPGCASYDMFTDFEERGDAFARAVEALDAA